MYNPFLTEETFFVATKCCLVKDGHILIVWENRPGKDMWWELPGWKISKADSHISPIESLSRELKEELWSDYGILEWNPELFMVHKSYEDTTFSSEKVPFIFLCYLYELAEGNTPIFLSHEHTEFRWIKESDVNSLSWWRAWFDTIVLNAFKYASRN